MSATTPLRSTGLPASAGWAEASTRPSAPAGGGVEWFAAPPAHGATLSARVAADAPKDADGWARRLVGHLLDDPAEPASR